MGANAPIMWRLFYAKDNQDSRRVTPEAAGFSQELSPSSEEAQLDRIPLGRAPGREAFFDLP